MKYLSKDGHMYRGEWVSLDQHGIGLWKKSPLYQHLNAEQAKRFAKELQEAAEHYERCD